MHPSATIAAMQAANALRAAGHDVIDLSIGEPDFDTPEHIKQYAVEALRQGVTKYTPTAGLKKLQEAIINFYQKQFAVEFKPQEVMAVSGGKQAIFNAVLTIANPGDDVLLHTPYWVSFPEIVNFTGANIVAVNTEATEFVLTAEQVKSSITPKTKLMIINSPGNPSGRVIPPAEFRKIVEVCAENNVYVISDECYLKFVYPPHEVFSLAGLPKELLDYVCLAGTFSKTFAMTGWRVGYTIANADWTKAMAKLQSHSTSHPTSFAQFACAEALNHWDETKAALDIMLAEYEKRRDYLIPALQNIRGFKCAEPEGAFYAFPDVRGCLNEKIKTSAAFCDLLLNEAHVVLTDGEGFGAPGFARVSYAASLERLHEAIGRIENVVAGLS